MAREHGQLKAGCRQRSDSTHILGAMRTLTRLEGVTETVRHALNVLASVAPAWLHLHTDVTWVERYGFRASEYRLPSVASITTIDGWRTSLRVRCTSSEWLR